MEGGQETGTLEIGADGRAMGKRWAEWIRRQRVFGYVCVGCQARGRWEVGWALSSQRVGAGGLTLGEAWSGLLPPPGFPKAEPKAKLVGYFLIRVS